SPATSSAAQITVFKIFIAFVFLYNAQTYEILPVEFHFYSLRRTEPSRDRPASGKKVFMFNLAYEKPTLF
ncbi:MAG: hypothetical protein IKG87_03135, partial [Clostridia bacterium]|nr:hypothetical protein [Clostridia bacterium]